MKTSQSLDIFAFILAGGIGTRFWPLSTPELPKQFLSPPIDDLQGKTFLQATYTRCKTFTSSKHIFIITHERFHDLVKQQIPSMPSTHIILEPEARDTAGALALALAVAKSKSKNFSLVILPSDHVISPTHIFQRDIRFACQFAKEHEALLTLGVKPTYPATGFGYMKKGPSVFKSDNHHVFKLDKFIEKPNLTRAKQLISKKESYFWNSGIFIFDGEAIRKNLKNFLPLHFKFSEFFSRHTQGDWGKQFSKLPKVSIDIGIMEKTENCYLYPARFTWDDVGSWNGLEKYLQRDQHNTFSNVELIAKQSTGNVFLVDKKSDSKIVALGIRDIYVVQKDGRLFLCHKDQIDLLKEIVQEFYEAL